MDVYFTRKIKIRQMIDGFKLSNIGLVQEQDACACVGKETGRTRTPQAMATTTTPYSYETFLDCLMKDEYNAKYCPISLSLYNVVMAAVMNYNIILLINLQITTCLQFRDNFNLFIMRVLKIIRAHNLIDYTCNVF